jgi:subtilisin family serine protease
LNKVWFIAIILFGLCNVGLVYAQTAGCTPGVRCEEEATKPPRIFDLEILVRQVQKIPKPQVIVKPTKKVTVVKKPLPKPVTKTAVIQKKPIAKPAAKKVVKVVKPAAPKPSWFGLPEIPVTILLAEDFDDIAGQYIIDLNAAAFAAAGLDLLTISRADLAGRLGLQPNQIRSIQRRFLLSVVLKASPEQAAALARNPLVLTVHADTKIKAAGGGIPLSWGLDRLDSPSLPLDGSFNRSFGDYNSRIYLFDQGVDRWHSEFESRAKFGSSFIDALPHRSGKCREHGTEMAALIAGGSTGAAPKAEVVDLVVLPCSRNQTGEASSLIEAAEWLLIREADFGDGKPAVANMSLTGKWSRKINSAVSVLTKNGVAVVVAAGNNAQDACRFSPASAKDAVTVAATDANDKTPGFSNFGQCVDIHAPGRLLTTLTENTADRYVAVNGTSGAAALVSGLLARSLKVKGSKAADQWLSEAAAPSQYWRKEQTDVLLAQASSGWRKLCRVSGAQGSVTMRFRPSPSAEALKQVSKNSLVSVESVANQWARVSTTDGTRGWLSLQKSGTPTLLELNQDSLCSVLQ